MTTGKVAAIAKSMLGIDVSSAVADYIDEHPDIFTDYAKVDGSYASLTAGNAEQLVSTVGVEDKTPYLFRTTGGSADVGDRVKLSEITGGTVAWNQLVQNGNFADGTNKWAPIYGTYNSITTENGELNCKVLKVDVGNNYSIAIKQNKTIPENHVVLISAEFKPMYSHSMGFCFVRDTTKYPSGQNVSLYKPCTAGQWNVVSSVTKLALGNAVLQVQFDMRDDFGYAVDDVDLCRNINLYDLTQMFGPTIADYIYSLEQANSGAGVAWFRKLFPKPYYAYDAGSLQSVNTSAHKTVGFNAFDKAKIEDGYISNATGGIVGSATSKNTGYIQVVGGMTYYIKSDAESGRWGAWYDADKNFISGISGIGRKTAPTNACYLRFTVVYNTVYGNPDTFCINLHWDGERDGEYEPYVEYNYPLDSDLELRGIPKLDASNNLYYDGDGYAPDGTVTRKYAVRAYEEGDATDGSTMITDGTNTVYKLNTPTTESADPFTETQVCNDFGTEEFVDSRTVPMPVGANALYQANLRAKLEMAPDSPDGDGDYIVRQTDGLNEYVAVSSNSTISGLSTRCPACPTDTDGNFVLKAVVSSGSVTYSWVAEA